MRNTKPLHKRVLAIFLCLMLLCGTVAGTMNWSVFANASELEKFSVDFQALTDLVTEKGKIFTDGYYSSQVTDTFINEWVAERFDLYFNYQLKAGATVHPDKTKFTKRAYLGQKATELTNSSGNSWWDISDAGRLAVGTAGNSGGDAKNSGHGGNYLSGGNALTLRHNGDTVELRNFETEIVFNTSAEYTAGAVYVSFHEDVPGRFSWQANYTDTSVLQNDAVIVAATADIRAETAYTYCEGVVVRRSGNAIENNWGGTIPEADRFYKDGAAYSLGQNKDYKLYVKVLNGTASIKVTSADGTVTYYSGEKEVSDGYGTISVGVTGRCRHLETIHVTELDENGNAVDLGTLKAEKDADMYELSVDFADLAQIVTDNYAFTDGAYKSGESDTAVNAWVNARFGLYYNRESHTFAEKTYLGETHDVSGGNNSYWQITQTGYLRAGLPDSRYGEYLRTSETLYLKENGKAVKLDNFEASVVFNMDDTLTTSGQVGAMYVSFNSITPGKFSWMANHNSLQGTKYVDDSPNLQDAIIIAKEHTTGNIGLMVKSSGETLDVFNGDNTPYTPFDAALALTPNVDYTLNVIAVGNDVTVSVKETVSGTVLLEEITYEGAVTGDEGYVSFGVAQAGAGIKSIAVTELKDTVPDTAVDTFEANFAELSALVTDTQYNGSETYQSQANDTAINTWVNERFGLYYNREVHTFAERQYLGQNSNEINNDRYTGPHYFLINKNGWLTHNTEWTLGDSMFRKGAAMWLKYNGEAAQLKNFEASLTFQPISGDGAQGSVYIAFHGATPGRFSWAKNGDDDSAIKQDAVIVGFDKNQKHGVTVKKYGEEISNNTLGAHFGTNLTFGAWYTLTVRVIGTDVDVLVKAENGAQVYKATYTNAVSDNVGSAYIGTANSPFSFESFSVTELDESGNAVAFGTMTNKLSDEGGFAVDFSDLATVVSESYSFTDGAYKSGVNDAAINAWVNERFALYFNRECWSHKQKSYLGEENATGGDVSYLSIAQNGYLRAGMANSTGGETLRTAETLTVKHDGDAIKLNNFEASVVFNVDDTITTTRQPTAVYVAFNQTVAGKFGWKVNPQDAADTYFVQPDAIIISKEYYTQNGTAGLTVKSGGETIRVNPNDVTFDRTFTLSADTDYTLYVRVVDKDVTVSLTETASGRAIVSQTTYTGAVTGDMGYVSFGLAQAGAGFKSIRLIQLDEDGRRVEFGTAVTPGIDEENTVLYKFNDENGLDDFESYFMPETNSKGVPAIYTEGTADDNMLLRNGTLAYQANSLCKTTAEYNAGVEINGVTYQDPSSWRTGFANNVGIAVLKTEKYKNFILDVDYTTGGYWPIVGFGAHGTSVDDVFWTQKNGGYIVRAESASGKAEIKFSGYNPSVETSVDFSSVFVEPYTSSGTHHMRLVVSDGMVYVYLDDIEEMVSWEIPDTYVGGYIYLAANNPAVTFDNLQIMDLDKKDIEITTVDMEKTSVTIDRSAGDILSLPASVTGYDTDGRAYDIQVSWNNDDYYSYKEGTYTFTMQSEMSAFKLSDSVPTMQVINKINGDFDPETSIKYYFDYDNELNDFLCYYSQKNYGGITGKWSADDAVLVKGDPLTMWKTANGKVSTAYIGEAGGHSWRNMGKSISTMLLKEYQLKNYRLEIEYTHAPHSIWYAYVLNCVQDPGQFFASYYSANPEDYATGSNLVKSYNDVAAGLYTYLEREGRINVYGANSIVDTEERLTYSSPLSEEDDFFDTYDYNVPHKMTITVVNGVMSIQVDDCIPYLVELEDAALGGYVGFAGMGNGETFSNLVLTALDEDGNVIPLDEAEQGFGNGDVPSIHEVFVGWKPSSDAWEFNWNKNYIFSY